MRIPGTFFDIELKLLNDDANSIEFSLIKNNDVVFNQKIKSFNEIGSILTNTLERYGVALPKVRMDKILSDLEGEFYLLQDNQKKKKMQQIQRQQASTQALSSAVSSGKAQKFLLMGMSNVGKTSIFQVVFEGKLPHETKILMPTVGTERHEIVLSSDQKSKTSLMIWDLGGQEKFMGRYFTEPELTFGEASVLIFVIDAYNVDMYEESRRNLHKCVTLIKKHGTRPTNLPKNETNIFCLLHKMDQFGSNREEQYKQLIDYFRLNPETNEQQTDILFFDTSIFDSSIFSAWTKITQKIVPKSSKLNLMAQEFKEDLKAYAVLIIEKRTGLPISASRTLLDDSALIGSTSRIMIMLEKVLPEFELTKLRSVNLETANGNLIIKIFNKFYLLVLLLPTTVDVLSSDFQARVQHFMDEMEKLI
jgi:GTPase SAR1 family protein/predicted regulator of Ras-like GTPase activity (Roadblock/LC7/MglB family)